MARLTPNLIAITSTPPVQQGALYHCIVDGVFTSIEQSKANGTLCQTMHSHLFVPVNVTFHPSFVSKGPCFGLVVLSECNWILRQLIEGYDLGLEFLPGQRGGGEPCRGGYELMAISLDGRAIENTTNSRIACRDLLGKILQQA